MFFFLVRMKDQLSAKRLKAFFAFLCSQFDRWPIMEGRAALSAFLFFTPRVHGVNSYRLRLHLYRHGAGFSHPLGSKQRLSPVQHTALHSQVHTKKAPWWAKWCEPPFLAPFVCQSWAWSFQNRSGGTFTLTSAHCPVSSLHLLFGEKWGDRELRKSLSSPDIQTSALLTNIKTNPCLFLSLFSLIETICGDQISPLKRPTKSWTDVYVSKVNLLWMNGSLFSSQLPDCHIFHHREKWIDEWLSQGVQTEKETSFVSGPLAVNLQTLNVGQNLWFSAHRVPGQSSTLQTPVAFHSFSPISSGQTW